MTHRLPASQSRSPGAGIRKEDQASARTSGAGESKPAAGLPSWGEFGPILGLVLVDAAKGKLGWSHWEQRNGAQVAVFHFAIDRGVSHYNVQYCCVQSREVIGSSYSSGGKRAAADSKAAIKECSSPESRSFIRSPAITEISP